MSKEIRIKGLPSGVSVEEIKQFCVKMGEVDVITPLHSGEALVTFSSKDAATAAVTQLSGRSLKGSQVLVELTAAPASKLSDLLGSFQDLSPGSKSSFLTQLQSAGGAGASAQTSSKVSDQKSNVKGVESLIPGSGVVLGSSQGTVTSGPLVRTEIPRLPMFSGDPNSKNDTPYTQWQYEVRSLMNDSSWSSAVIMQAIRRSTKGLAATLLHSLGIAASAQQVLDKFEVVFGNILSGDDLMQEFYTSKQKEDECVAEWSCRLEELSFQVKEKGVKQAAELESLLRHQFWRGITSEFVRTGLRHLYTSNVSYDSLVMSARSLENEYQAQSTKPVASKKVHQQALVASDSDKLDLIVQELKDMKTRLVSLEQARANESQGKKLCYECQGDDHLRDTCPKLGRDKKDKGKGRQNHPPKQKGQGNGSRATLQGK